MLKNVLDALQRAPDCTDSTLTFGNAYFFAAELAFFNGFLKE